MKSFCSTLKTNIIFVCQLYLDYKNKNKKEKEIDPQVYSMPAESESLG